MRVGFRDADRWSLIPLDRIKLAGSNKLLS